MILQKFSSIKIYVDLAKTGYSHAAALLYLVLTYKTLLISLKVFLTLQDDISEFILYSVLIKRHLVDLVSKWK